MNQEKADPTKGASGAPSGIQLPEAAIINYCRRWQIREMAIFGSALRQDFGPESDVDLLVTFDEDARWTLFDLARMKDELEKIVGREVDLVSRRGIESSRNHLRRQEILSSAKVVHVA